jgi:hypothetical protein
MSVTRGCGQRVKSGVYAECPLSPYGNPLEDFLVDPPIPIIADDLGVTPIGVKLVERKGVWHIMDWVGSTHYRNTSDYVEEVRRLGLSRRLSTTLDFKKLTSQSRILLMHSHAYIYNFDEYKKQEPSLEDLQGLVPYPDCPKELEEHIRPEMKTMCARLWYQDVEGGEDIQNSTVKEAGRLRCVTRKMPSFEYHALKAPEGVKPDHRLAIFASFPITNLAVIKDPDGGTHNRSMMLAEEARLPVKLLDE